MKIGKTLYVHKREQWRAWLKKNHAKASDIWLVYYKKASGKPRIPYNDTVDEALCFGWIDSIAKPIDEDRYCQRFSPRRKGSPCSELNKARAIRMVREGRMTPAGLAALSGTLGDGAEIKGGSIRHTKPLLVPPDVEAALKKAPGAWQNFQKFPLAYKRIRVVWITSARVRPEIFKTRLAYFVKKTAKNERFGMVRG